MFLSLLGWKRLWQAATRHDPDRLRGALLPPDQLRTCQEQHAEGTSTGWQVPTSASQPPGFLASKTRRWALIFQNLHLHGAPAWNVSQTSSIHLICTNFSQQNPRSNNLDRAWCILSAGLLPGEFHPALTQYQAHIVSCFRLLLPSAALAIICLRTLSV
jgi:hypothetical protein